jgi:hypothetical protein
LFLIQVRHSAFTPFAYLVYFSGYDNIIAEVTKIQGFI